MKKDLLSFISRAGHGTVLKKENAFLLKKKFQETCAKLYEENVIYEIFEFACGHYKDRGRFMYLNTKNTKNISTAQLFREITNDGLQDRKLTGAQQERELIYRLLKQDK